MDSATLPSETEAEANLLPILDQPVDHVDVEPAPNETPAPETSANHSESAAAWHNPIVDFLRKRLSYSFWGRRYLKAIVEDVRTLGRTFVDWKRLENEIPDTVTIETVNVCNANCVFCAYQFQEKFRKTRGVMSDELFERAIQQCGELGAKMIDLTPLVGEALLDPNILDRVETIKARGFQVEVFTNGIRLEKLDLSRLVAAVDHVSLSTAPFDKDIYAEIYRSRGYDRMLKGIVRMLELRNRTDANLRLNINFRSPIPFRELVALPDFRDKVQPLLRDSERAAVYAQIKSFDSWGGSIGRDDLPGIMDIATKPRLKHRPCMWTFRPVILWDGRVRACCRFISSPNQDGEDGLMVGNIGTTTLREMWNGEQIRNLRRRFPAGNLPEVCSACTMYRSC